MTRSIRTRITAALGAVLTLGALASAVVASPALASAPIAVSPDPASLMSVRADVDDFEIGSFDASYELGRDEDRRSSLTTVEHIVAVFPDFDQNRGLIRDLTRVYDGHDTELRVLSVTDEHGTPRDYTTEPAGDFLSVIMAVPEGEYVHGEQHYIVTYAQRDVTRHFDDTGADEFYWDVNGTGWTQPFGSVSATISLDDSIASNLTGSSACYVGSLGSNDACSLIAEGTGFFAEAGPLGTGENVTFALGFEPDTFAPAPTPPVPFLQRVPVLLWAGYASLAGAIGTFCAGLFRSRRARTGRAIIAQYEPPKDLSVAVAAELLGRSRQAMTATLLDFAVRRKLRLLHHAESDQYGAQALDDSGLLPIEHRSYVKIFTGGSASSGLSLGETQWFSKTSTRLGDAAVSLRREAKAELTKLGLVRGRNGGLISTVIILAVLALGLPVLHSIIVGDFVLMTVLLAVGINVLIWSLFGAIALLAVRRRPTASGALLLDHLWGLREYIRLAEADRIRMLQSASGAEVDEQFIVQVYERLLPYAVLFGFEREWQEELATYYRESVPDWVVGSEGDAGSSFTRMMPMAGFSHAVAASPRTVATSSGGSGSGSSFSSFSGGSSGGGFSGGGGGGGGGRGI